MGKVNVYLPDDLERAVRQAELPVSPICQAALRDALDRLGVVRSEGRGAFTPRLDEVVERARSAARAKGRKVTPEDMFGAVVDHGENLGARALAMMGVELPAPKRRRAPSSSTDAGELGPAVRELLATAFRISLEMHHRRVGTEHVVIALASEGSPLAPMFDGLGIEARGLRRQVERLIANPWTTEGTPPTPDLLTVERLDAAVQELTAELERLKQQRND